MRRIFSAPQSRPSCARQAGHRYRLRRRAIDSAPLSSLVTGRASRSSSALRTDGLSEIARVAGFSCARRILANPRFNNVEAIVEQNLDTVLEAAQKPRSLGNMQEG